MSREVIEEQNKFYEKIGKYFQEREEKLEDKKELMIMEYKDKILQKEMEIKGLRIDIIDLRKQQRENVREMEISFKEDKELYELQLKVWRDCNHGKAFKQTN